MTEILYVLIILPMIVFIMIALVFSTSANTRNDQWIANCPYPIYQGVAENVTLASDGTRVTFYEVDYSAAGNNQTGTYWKCHFDDVTGNPSLSVIAKNYGKTEFGQIPTGWFAWASDSISIFFAKLPAWSNIIWTILSAPSVVTGLSWFGYVQLALVVLVILGVVLVVKP